MDTLHLRFATTDDIPQILGFTRALAAYEHMETEVVATEEHLHKWLFVKQKSEVLIGETEGLAVGFALFFHNFSTFLGLAGIYLEDLYVKPAYRGRGFGKVFLVRLAAIVVERRCGRFER